MTSVAIDGFERNKMKPALWTPFLVFQVVLLEIQSTEESVPSRNKNAYFWEEKSPAATTHRSKAVATQADLNYAIGEDSSNRRLFGRHVCSQNQVRMMTMREMQSYCKPAYHSYLRRCDMDVSGFCPGYRVVYEIAYRAVQRVVAKTESVPICCPGWTQNRISSTDCRKAICREECQNGGECSRPDHCSCSPGWTGKICEKDVNECSKKKDPCDQECTNAPGSYRCSCRPGHVLQEDGRTCKKIVSSNPSEKLDIDEKLLKKMESLQKRLDALEDWQKRLSGQENKEDARHQRDDRINSLSEQIAILEEKLADCSCIRKEEISFPRSQK